jgi:hypothetical protein
VLEIFELKKLLIPLICCFFLFLSYSSAQTAIDKKVSINVENKVLVEIIYDISKKNQVTFYFDPNSLPYYTYNRKDDDKQLWKLLTELLNGTTLKALPYDENALLIIDRDKTSRAQVDTLIAKWNDGRFKYPFDTRLKQLDLSYPSQNTSTGKVNFTFSVKDKEYGEPIIGAVIRNQNLSVNGVTDIDGRCTLNLYPGTYDLELTYTGYQGVDLNLLIEEDARADIEMEVQSFMLEEIEITAFNAQEKIENTRTGVEVIDIGKLEVIPQVMGDVDIIKSLELLPGVTSVGELSSGFNVRGGNIDESLVLLNDGIIFNPTHVIGFISAFNSDAVKSATLYKGYVDGGFGNRSSAVLDLNSSPRKKESIGGKGGIGTTVVKLMLEGPVGEKVDFLVSGRGSFSDYILDRIPNVELQNSSAQFYDGNFVLNYEISDRQSIDLSGYISHDFFEYNKEFGFEWDNRHLGARWSGSWSDDWYSTISLNYGAYHSAQSTINSAKGSRFSTELSYYKGLASLTRSWGESGYIKAGFEAIDYSLAPDNLVAIENSVVQGGEIQRKASMSMSPFITIKKKINDQISAEASLRWSNYQSKGPGNIYTYSEDIIDELNISGVTPLEGADPEGKYSILEPRVSLNYKISDNWSFKGGFNVLSQNAQLLTVSNTALPTDYWIFSDRYIEPQKVTQYSVGLFHNDGSNRFNFSIEGFYKDFQNATVLRDFPELILNDHIETEVVPATGESYGAEFLIEKTKGRLTGSVAYTYSRTLRQTKPGFEQINQGAAFPSDFDIPHQLNVLGVFQWLPAFSINLAYVYKSGRPITVPESSILQDNYVLPLYTGRNQNRIPNYQRVDLSMTLDLRKNKREGFRSSFTFGLYNFFGRKNAYNVFFRRSDGGNVVPFKFSLIGNTVPSLSWNFTF